jgi:hypothetical protein
MTLEEQNLLDPVDITAETAEEATEEAIPENEIAEESFNEAEKTVNEEEESPEEEIEPSLPEVEDDIPDLTEILALRAELDSLKRELEENRAFYTRLDGECAEFSSLYPDVSITSLPDTVWQSVKKGVPLSAAYALEVRRAEVKAQKARQVNRDNSEMSSGALGNNNRNDFFSPAEVRAMSASEVRANYSKIIESMSKWH